MHGNDTKTDMKASGTEDPDINLHSYSHLIFFFLMKEPKTCDEEKTASSTNGAGKTGYLHAGN
jgi:hypothetical protein